MGRAHLKQEFGKTTRESALFLRQAEDIQRDLLGMYVANHVISKIGVPISCIVVAATVSAWAPVNMAILWAVICCLISAWTTYVCMGFGDGAQIPPNQTKTWFYRLLIPRALFSISWTSLVFWAVDPAQDETFFIVSAILISTIAMNASQSGPIIELYFIEMLTKFFPMLFIAFTAENALYTPFGIMSIAAVVFFTKIAFSINETSYKLLRQKKKLAQAKEDVERASNAKSAFLATMSHEVRTPLNGILGIANLMKYTQLNDQQNEYVDTIKYSGETLLTMLNDILDFSKIEAGQMGIEKISFESEKLIKSVVKLLESRALEKQIHLEFSIESNVPPYIISDPTRLRQVLLNLISNALKFTNRGVVKVDISVDKQYANLVGVPYVDLRFAVSDTGIGIPEEAKANLFQDFVQIDSSISRRYGGTGLGLSICKRIVGLMKGRIGFESTLGAGSTFWFVVPVAVSNHDSTVISLSANEKIPLLRPLQVLLAEDNAVNQQVAVGLLSKYGHQVHVANNGQKAFEDIQKSDFDVVLMDIQMPIVDGLSATKMIKSLGGLYMNVPIIALTANADADEKTQYLKAGIVDYIEKPLRVSNLFQVLSKHLPTHRTAVN